jgi:hypothetical protein
MTDSVLEDHPPVDGDSRRVFPEAAFVASHTIECLENLVDFVS